MPVLPPALNAEPKFCPNGSLTKERNGLKKTGISVLLLNQSNADGGAYRLRLDELQADGAGDGDRLGGGGDGHRGTKSVVERQNCRRSACCIHGRDDIDGDGVGSERSDCVDGLREGSTGEVDDVRGFGRGLRGDDVAHDMLLRGGRSEVCFIRSSSLQRTSRRLKGPTRAATSSGHYKERGMAGSRAVDLRLSTSPSYR